MLGTWQTSCSAVAFVHGAVLPHVAVQLTLGCSHQRTQRLLHTGVYAGRAQSAGAWHNPAARHNQVHSMTDFLTEQMHVAGKEHLWRACVVANKPKGCPLFKRAALILSTAAQVHNSIISYAAGTDLDTSPHRQLPP